MPMRAAAPAAAALVGLAASAVAATAAGAAPALTFDRPCVNRAQTFGVVGTGFAPGSAVAVDADTGRKASFVADAAGSFAGTLEAPSLIGSSPLFGVKAVDADHVGVVLATAPMMIVKPRLLVLPTRIHAERPIRVSVRGLTPGKPVFAHVNVRGRWIRTRTIGVAGAPCGSLIVRQPIMRGLGRRGRNFRIVRLQVDQLPTPSATTRPAGTVTFYVRRPVRSAGYRNIRLQVLRSGFRDAVAQAPS